MVRRGAKLSLKVKRFPIWTAFLCSKLQQSSRPEAALLF